jgi:hypothetical protein
MLGGGQLTPVPAHPEASDASQRMPASVGPPELVPLEPVPLLEPELPGPLLEPELLDPLLDPEPLALPLLPPVAASAMGEPGGLPLPHAASPSIPAGTEAAIATASTLCRMRAMTRRRLFLSRSRTRSSRVIPGSSAMTLESSAVPPGSSAVPSLSSKFMSKSSRVRRSSSS